MNAKTKIHQAHLQTWAAHIADQASSGLTVRAWCSLNNISIHKYNYWKHLLKEEITDMALPDIVPVTLPDVVHQKSYNSRNSSDLYNSCNSVAIASPTPSPISITINDIRIDIDASTIYLLPDIIKAVRNA